MKYLIPEVQKSSLHQSATKSDIHKINDIIKTAKREATTNKINESKF